jgi:hypothetical protein
VPGHFPLLESGNGAFEVESGCICGPGQGQGVAQRYQARGPSLTASQALEIGQAFMQRAY